MLCCFCLCGHCANALLLMLVERSFTNDNKPQMPSQEASQLVPNPRRSIRKSVGSVVQIVSKTLMASGVSLVSGRRFHAKGQSAAIMLISTTVLLFLSSVFFL